jgi:hypothetical protein
MKCKACGDRFDPSPEVRKAQIYGSKPAIGELEYCLECADELFRGRLHLGYPIRSGGPRHGLPLDPSASQENAIRAMEGDS